ncbi:GNAT family N-acetyltransferase [Hanstruepera ponticola]|uniref:GNAT family N-acetyltransferase n=1 Tax=Hanstruepera ponticola TaxID=2042995 RepID=UPI000CF07D49|nr:GNAT family N-acetyltransferase [Hanstruepera ponticola]
MTVDIIPFNVKYAQDFYNLNVEWLETHFYVEDFDREVLSKPEKYIISKGGYIFFAQKNNSIVGTVALMPTAKQNVFELTKMAVLPELRGEKIGQQILAYCIDFAKTNNFEALMLYSNTKLENAIYIYKKFGFKELQLEENSPYKRSNIKMLLNFNVKSQ